MVFLCNRLIIIKLILTLEVQTFPYCVLLNVNIDIYIYKELFSKVLKMNKGICYYFVILYSTIYSL